MAWTMATTQALPKLREKFREATVGQIESHIFNALSEYAVMCEKEPTIDPSLLQSVCNSLGAFVKDGHSLMYLSQCLIASLQAKILASRLAESM